jgi:crotonobetainyl-CoA:carnitine CoA-transferase CaiB-like acyl-CoA transferase
MMDGIMNLCRVKWRDHQRLTRQSLAEYSVATHQGMGAVPRAGNDSGGGQLGNAIRCNPGGTNDFLYVVVQEAVWDALARRIGPEVGMPDLATDPKFATIDQRRRYQCWRSSASSLKHSSAVNGHSHELHALRPDHTMRIANISRQAARDVLGQPSAARPW